MFIIRLGAEALSIADSHPSAAEKYLSKPSNQQLWKESSVMNKTSTNFLYSILSGEEDTTVAQQRSQLATSHSEPSHEALAYLSNQQQKQRSNSVIVHRSQIKCSSGNRRPSSVPQSTRYTPYPVTKKFAACHQQQHYNHQDNMTTMLDQVSLPTYSNHHSPARSVSTDSGLDEPLDLTKQGLPSNGHHAGSPDFSDSDSISSSPSRCSDPLGPPFTMPTIPHHQHPRLQMSVDSHHHYSHHRPSSPPSEYVQLAKKMARPVQSRVSEWFRQMTELVTQSGPDGSSRLARLPADLRLRLLQNSWHRVLVLYMAEHNLRFATSPLHETCLPGNESKTTTNSSQPIKSTQTFVDQLTDLIECCSSLPFDHPTYDLIRIAVILMDNKSSLNSPNLGLLENYLTTKTDASQLRGVMQKISDLDKTQLEALFCAHLNVPVEDLLKSLFSRSDSVYSSSLSTVN